MPTVNIYDMQGEVVGECELSDTLFGVKPNETALHTMVRHHLAACRQGTQSTLTRSEVRGGGAKPWRQKGTGRARQGSNRAPQWTHGGVALGPKPRSYRFHVNKKIRRLAMKSALSSKVLSGGLLVIDNLEMPQIKTKEFRAFLDSLPVSGKALVITPEPRENVIKSARNIQGVKTAIVSSFNVYDLVNAGRVLIDKAAVDRLEEVYAG